MLTSRATGPLATEGDIMSDDHTVPQATPAGFTADRVADSACRVRVTRTLVKGYLRPTLAELDEYGRHLLEELIELQKKVKEAGGSPVNAPLEAGEYRGILRVFADLYPVDPMNPLYQHPHDGAEATWDTHVMEVVYGPLASNQPAR